MTASDVKFIDKYLAHIDPQRRIIAVNKCDLEPNEAAILSHIRENSGQRRLEDEVTVRK